MTRQGLPDSVGRALVAAIFENKDHLAIPGRYATNIQPPNTEKEASITALPAAAAYFEDQTKTFIDRYSDLMFLVLWIGSLVGSAFLWLYSQVTRVTPIQAGDSQRHSTTCRCARARRKTRPNSTGSKARSTGC